MYSRVAPATSIVNLPLSTAAVEPQPALRTGAPSAGGSVAPCAAGGATAGGGIAPSMGGGVSPTLAGSPSGELVAEGVWLGWAWLGAGATGSFIPAGEFIATAELTPLGS